MLAITMICASCQRGEMEDVEQGQPATIRLEVRGEEEVDVATRTVNEDAINDMHVLIYNNAGELIGQKYQSGGGTVTVDTRSATGCNIYVIANTGNENLFKGYDIHSESTLKNMVKTVPHANTLNNGSNLPMTGSRKNVNISAGTNSLGRLEVTRMVAKINLNIKAKENSGITISEYIICNVPFRTWYVPRPLSTESETDDSGAGEDAASPDNNSHWTNTPTKNLPTATTSIETTFYMFENRRGVKTGITEQKDKNNSTAPKRATYVYIKGKIGEVAAIWSVYLGANNKTNFNIKRNREYTYNIKLNDTALTDTRIDMDFTNVIDLTTAGTANCYLLAKTCTWYKFKATVRGNGATTAAEISPTGSALPANAAINPASVELVWETGQPKGIIQSISLTSDKKYVLIKTGHLAEGNAVVAVKDAAGNILWSWHIWKTHFDLSSIPTQTYRTTPRHLVGPFAWIYKDGLSSHDYIMMDRNLGASDNTPSNTEDVARTFGLYYQFGRKDPFPSTAGRSSISSDFYDKNGTKTNNLKNIMNSTISKQSTQLIKYSVNNPDIFISKDENDKTATGGDGTNPSNNWIYGAFLKTTAWQTSYKLWGGDLPATESMRLGSMFTGKTIYDPCPYGWCLPRQDTWLNFTTSTDDYNLDSNLGPAIGDVRYYNSPDDDKQNYVGGNFTSASVFGRRFYIIGNSGATAFYPAAGYRHGNSGWFDGIGTVCHVWSSEPFQWATIVGAALNAGVSWVDPVGNSSPSNALPVRCVKESSIK